jgi:hypothetical protein
MPFHAHGGRSVVHRSAASAVLAGLVLAAGWAHAQTPVTITSPNLAGAISGALPGAASVSPGGGATYSVPLVVPPGTAGIAPAPSLEYSSQAGMGLLGHGWGLTGLSSISRCGKTRVHDGNSVAVQLTADDPLCLDGRRLLRVSGTHGATAEYRTEIDDFSRIQSTGSDPAIGPDSFRVAVKGGLIYTYGLAADATIEAAGKTVRHTWALHRVEDRRGNYYTYSYSENNATGEYFPTQVRYTGNLVSGLAPYNAVRFIYEARPDPWRTWLAGSPVNHTQRITAVRTVINTAADGSGGTPAREYRIAYRTNPTNGRSLVDSISDCDAAGQCLPPTRFAWTQRTAAHNNFNAPGSGNWGGPVAVYASLAHKNVWNSIATADMNGDGKTDLIKSLENGTWQVCLSTGSAFNCQTWAGPNRKISEVAMGDFNGDARTDLAFYDGTNGNVCFSTATAFNCVTSNIKLDSYWGDYFADFDADGRDDHAFCYSQGNGSFSCDSGTLINTAPVHDENAICPEEIQVRKNIRADFTGDGKADFLVINMWSAVCSQGNAHNYAWELRRTVNGGAQRGWPHSTDDNGLPRVDINYGRVFPPGSSTGYFNDDPYTDLILESLTGSALRICANTGAARFECTAPAVDATQYDQVVRHVGDFDGDSRPDTLHFGASNQPRVCQMGGNGSYTCADWAGPASVVFADFDADGKTDLATYSDTTQWTIALANGPVPDLLLSVTNGQGHSTEFSYAGLNNPAVYTRGADVAYPKRNIPAGSTVVSQVRTANALGGWLATTYTYEGLRTDLQGRGSLGFAAVKVTDGASGVTTTTRYSQDFPSTGMPQSTQSVSAAGVVLSATTHTLAAMTTTAGATHPYVQASSVTTRDLNNAAISTATTQVNAGGIDAYGNVTSSTATTAAGGETFNTTTVNTYDNLTAPWLIGLLRTSTVTKTATQAGTATTPPTLAFSNCSSTTPTTTPTAARMTCTLANQGQAVALGLSYAAPAGTTVAGPASCAGMNANCGTVTVTTSTAAGSYSGNLTATSTPAGTAASTAVALTVNAVVPILSANPTSLNFGTVRMDTATAAQSVTVTNVGAAGTTLSWGIGNYTSGSSANGSFIPSASATTCTTTGVLAPGASCRIGVYYQSVCTSGGRNASLIVSGTNAATVLVPVAAITTNGGCD